MKALGGVLHAAGHGSMARRWLEHVPPVGTARCWTGDALVTHGVVSRRCGPDLLPAALGADPAQARAPLSRSTGQAADTVVQHG